MYSADISMSLTVALMPRFSSTGLCVWPTSLSKIEVLHVAGADLEHIAVALHQRHLTRIHHLGDDRHSVLVAHVAEDAQTLLAESLKAVRTGARLERAAAKDVGTGFLDSAGDFSRIASPSMAHGPAINASEPPPMRTVLSPPLTSTTVSAE